MNIRNTLFLALLMLAAVMTSGCKAVTTPIPLEPVSFPDVFIPEPAVKRQGMVSVKVADTRPEKPIVGKLRARWPEKNPDYVIEGGLEPRLEKLICDMLNRAGYTVANDANAGLQVEVTEFKLQCGIWTQGATEKIQCRLRDKTGRVIWEKAITGEDGGVGLVNSFVEKSMNVAVTRLLSNALKEFTSESFQQAVQQAGESK